MDYSSLFVQDSSFAHLNAGTRTRVPLEVLDFMAAEYRESEKNPTKAMFVGYDRLWATQKRLAAFLGAEARHIFLRSNVTAAFNDFLFALPALPQGEVVATGWEYGGILGAARQWAKVHGHGLRHAPLALKTDWTETELVDAVDASLAPDTRVLLVSHVATGTGAILPVARIAERARSRGVITVIDGAHAIGALPVNLASMPEADFYAGNFHKWFLGPEGTGFGWVHPRWEGKLEWKFGGWASERAPSFYQGFGDGDPETCRRFFPGTIDRVPFLALGETLSFWEKHGADKLRSRQKGLLGHAAREAEALGWERVSPEDPDLLGPLVSFRRPSAWGEGESIALATRLYQEARVQLALPQVQGASLVRFSPGVYARDEEITQAFERLSGFRG